MNGRPLLKALVWTMIIAGACVTLISVAIISMVVGDWVYLHTQSVWIASGCGIYVFLGFISSVVATAALWMWYKAPVVYHPYAKDNMSRLLAEISVSSQD